MKIFGFTKEHSEQEVTVTISESKVRLEYFGRHFEIDPSLVIKPDIAFCYEGLEKEMVLCWDSERFSTRDMASSVSERKGVKDINDPVAIVFFSETDTYVIVKKPVLKDQESVTELSEDDTAFIRPRQYISNLDLTIASFVDKCKKKRKLMSKLNPLDSLAALENQVDLLTSIVIRLMNGDPVPPWVKDFIKTMQQNSSFMGRTPEQVVAIVNDEKSKVRGLQKEYFNG